MVTLVSGFDDNLGQGRELRGANRRGHVGMFRFGSSRAPRWQPQGEKAGLESSGAHQDSVGQGVRGTLSGERLVLGKVGGVPTTGEQLGWTGLEMSPWIWQLGGSG